MDTRDLRAYELLGIGATRAARELEKVRIELLTMQGYGENFSKTVQRCITAVNHILAALFDASHN